MQPSVQVQLPLCAVKENRRRKGTQIMLAGVRGACHVLSNRDVMDIDIECVRISESEWNCDG